MQPLLCFALVAALVPTASRGSLLRSTESRAPLPSARIDEDVRGRYVEARTASVYAGACHYGGEATTDGREALLAFHVESGTRSGVDLAGGDVAVLVRGEANLADARAPRRSIVYVSASESRERRDALVATVRERCAPVVGAVDEVRAVDLSMRITDDGYAVRASGLFELEGAAMPDRACCKMPYNVWYAPFVRVEKPLVGLNRSFVASDKALGAMWSRPGENAAFLGRFALSSR